MKNITESIKTISEEDVFAIPHAVSDGVWVNGFYARLTFEAKVNDTSSSNSINNGRVAFLRIEDKFFTEDNSYTAQVAQFCDGEWLLRSSNVKTRKTIDALISRLEMLPSHEEFETQKQTA
jgi:hypothetical protein